MDFTNILIAIASFAVLIGIIITIHEGGHFIIGRMCGIKMLEFSIGFGPKIFARRFGKDNTLFTLRAIPMGGFVKPFDQSTVTPEEWENSSEEDKKRTFTIAKRWKKTLMVAGGPFANFVLAFFVYLVAMTLVGTKGVEPIVAEVLPQSVFAQVDIKPGDKIEKINGNPVKLLGDAYPMLVNGLIQGQTMHIATNRNPDVLVNFSGIDLKNLNNNVSETLGLYFQGNIGKVIVNNVSKGAPAEVAGLKLGDLILKVNEREFRNVDRAIAFINQNPNKELFFTVQRDDKEMVIPITPALVTDNGKELGRIGVSFKLESAQELKTVHYTFSEAVWGSTVKVWDSTYTTIVSIGKLITGQLSVKNISGPVAIADFSGQSAQHGLFQFMMMIAAISIAVGVFNLLPIPALDGGHLAQYAIEYVIGQDISPKIIHYGQVVGFGLIMGIFAMSMFNDLSKYLF